MAIIEWIMAELNLRPDDGRGRVKISRWKETNLNGGNDWPHSSHVWLLPVVPLASVSADGSRRADDFLTKRRRWTDPPDWNDLACLSMASREACAALVKPFLTSVRTVCDQVCPLLLPLLFSVLTLAADERRRLCRWVRPRLLFCDQIFSDGKISGEFEPF